MTINVEVADLPEVSAPKVAVLQELELVTLTPAIRAERGVRSARGALVYNVERPRLERDRDPAGRRDRADQPHCRSRRAADVRRAIDTMRAAAAIRVVCERGGQIYYNDVVIQ